MRLAWILDTPDSLHSLRNNGSHFSHASPTGLQITETGQLLGQLNPEILAEIRRQQLRLVPLVANAGFAVETAAALFGTASLRRKHADLLAARAEAEQWDGINLDIEGPFLDFRQEYVEFTALLKSKLGERQLSVDIVPRTGPATMDSVPLREQDPEGWVRAWKEPFDYAGLTHSADYLILMGYDYTSRLMQPGPVAPLPWLQAILSYAGSETQLENVVLGLPLYGRSWARWPGCSWAEGRTIVPRLLEGWPRRESDHQGHRCRVVQWQDDAGRHWGSYDTPETLAAKAQLAVDHGLAGTAFWRLGFEPAGFWERMQAPGSAGTTR